MTLISLITWAIFGALVGGIARAIAPTYRLATGWLPTIALGIVGSVVGGLPFGNGPAGLLGSVVGAVIVVLLHSWYSEAQS